MEPMLSSRQRQVLMLAAVLSLLILDAHALRIFLSAKQYLETQQKARAELLTRILRREVDVNSGILGGRGRLEDRGVPQMDLLQIGSRYGFISVEVINRLGILVASSQSGRSLLARDRLPGISPEMQRDLFQNMVPQVTRPKPAAEAAPQPVSAYVPFKTNDGSVYALKATILDDTLGRIGKISRDILVYQALGIAATMLLVGMLGFWIVRPYRRVLLAARTASNEVFAGKDLPQDDSAMMIASFQGVIAKLRQKEKELLEMSRLDRERAITATRLSSDILEQMVASVLMFSHQGRVVQSNRAASELFGRSSLVLYNQHYTRLLADEPQWQALVSRCIEDGERTQDQVLPLVVGSEERVCRVSATPVSDTEGKAGALCVIMDVTDRARLEKQLAESEKLAALGEMSRGLAHEIRNSLGTLVGLLRLLAPPQADSLGRARQAAGQLGVDEDRRRFREMMQKEVQEMNRIVSDFLDFTRPLSIRSEAVDCADVLRWCVQEILTQFPERSDSVSIEGGFARVKGDEGLLRQAFFNLIKNGIEAGENVRVRVSADVDTAARELHMQVQDGGPGIDPADLGKIFIPFYTTKEAGYGLGLALVEKTILAHSGRIDVESTLGKGTTFHLYLPLID
ncbi:MAG: ATP-binding protein [Acidobacteriota bacterium]